MINHLEIMKIMDHAAKLYKEIVAEQNRPKCPQCGAEIKQTVLIDIDPGEYKGDEKETKFVFAKCVLCGWETDKTEITYEENCGG